MSSPAGEAGHTRLGRGAFVRFRFRVSLGIQPNHAIGHLLGRQILLQTTHCAFVQQQNQHTDWFEILVSHVAPQCLSKSICRNPAAQRNRSVWYLACVCAAAASRDIKSIQKNLYMWVKRGSPHYLPLCIYFFSLNTNVSGNDINPSHSLVDRLLLSWPGLGPCSGVIDIAMQFGRVMSGHMVCCSYDQKR